MRALVISGRDRVTVLVLHCLWPKLLRLGRDTVPIAGGGISGRGRGIPRRSRSVARRRLLLRLPFGGLCRRRAGNQRRRSEGKDNGGDRRTRNAFAHAALLFGLEP